MTKKTKSKNRPEGMTDSHVMFLDALVKAGDVLMFGSSIPLKETFGLDHKTAKRYLRHWMETFPSKDTRTSS